MIPSGRLVVASEDLQWSGPPDDGVRTRRLAENVGPDRWCVEVVQLASGAVLPPPSDAGQQLELVVLDGALSTTGGLLARDGYAKLRGPDVERGMVAVDGGCTLFVRSGSVRSGPASPSADEASQSLVMLPQDLAWLPGQGGLRVKPLGKPGQQGAAYVHWPAGEHFQPHQHWGGEEVFVLSGEFCDEHGRYPAGTWLLSPHLSVHDPFVEQETVIFVKTGHLGLGAGA